MHRTRKHLSTHCLLWISTIAWLSAADISIDRQPKEPTVGELFSIEVTISDEDFFSLESVLPSHDALHFLDKTTTALHFDGDHFSQQIIWHFQALRSGPIEFPPLKLSGLDSSDRQISLPVLQIQPPIEAAQSTAPLALDWHTSANEAESILWQRLGILFLCIFGIGFVYYLRERSRHQPLPTEATDANQQLSKLLIQPVHWPAVITCFEKHRSNWTSHQVRQLEAALYKAKPDAQTIKTIIGEAAS